MKKPLCGIKNGGNMKKKIVFLLVLFLMTGCASRINKTMSSWIGHHQSELIASWGPPTRTSSDGKGGIVLVYESYRNMGTKGSVDSRGNIRVRDNSYIRTRMFYVNNNGIIYNWRWQGL